MSNKECHQFTTGLCLNDLFKTDKCPLAHSLKSQTMFEASNCLIGFEYSVLSDYSALIKECNVKIKKLNWLLKKRVISENDDLSAKLSLLIEKYPTCYSLVKIYCKTMKNKKYRIGLSADINVCKVCSALIKTTDKECGHFQHSSYKKMRDFREKLKKKVLQLESND